MVKFKAIGVSEGLAKAKALVIKEEDLSVVKETVADVEAECKRVLDAVEKPSSRSKCCVTMRKRISVRLRRKFLTHI